VAQAVKEFDMPLRHSALALAAVCLALVAVALIPARRPTTATPVQATRPSGSVPTPELHCGTPTPGVRPTDPAFFPNLVARGMARSCILPCDRCYRRAASAPGVIVDVGNAGITSSGPFLVEVYGDLQAVGDTQPGKFVNLFFPGYRAGETALVVDPLDRVYEAGREDDNALRGALPAPDCPPSGLWCTPAPPGDLPDLEVAALRIELWPGWQCGDPTTLGLTVGMANSGGAPAGPFVVTANGTPWAHDDMAAQASTEFWLPGYRAGAEQEAALDSGNQVDELNESNNTRRVMVPVPTLPPCPTTSPTQPPPASTTPTATAGATPAPTPRAIHLPWAHTGRD
jgi:hypothetical protein